MSPTHTHQIGALGAAVLALVLALLDRPGRVRAAPAEPALAWADAVETGADHITPAALADRMLAAAQGAADYVLVDVRPLAEFEAFHLPGAVRLSLPELLGARGEELRAQHSGKTLILYSNGPTHPGQAWVELSRRGIDVFVLDGGLDAFIAQELTPPSLRTVPAASAAQSARFAALRAHVLGTPQDPPPKQAQEPTTRLATDPDKLRTPTLVSTAWLEKHLGAVVVVDTREKAEAYAQGHVPGAVHAPVDQLRETRDGVGDELLRGEGLARKIGALGIDADTAVVAYGDDRLQDPAHFVIALVRLGHRQVAILEGGLVAWKHESRKLSQETGKPTAKTYTPRAGADAFTAVLADVKEASAARTVKILDVRPAKNFEGEETREARGGHIPGSLNRPFEDDVVKDARGVFFKPLVELRREYAALGLQPKEPVIVSCRTGHQAAQTWFTLRYLLGHEDVRWYDGSWKEWAAQKDLPADTGPGKRPGR